MSIPIIRTERCGHPWDGVGPFIVGGAGERGVRALVLQGVPIAEPFAARGPFAMNTGAELDAADHEFRTGQFGDWPWPTVAPTHGADERRFLRRPDGTTEWALTEREVL